MRKLNARLRRLATRTGHVLIWTLRLLLFLLVVDAFYLAVTWPDWQGIATGAVPKSRFIQDYERRAADDRNLPRLHWQPVPLSAMPKHLARAVILAEDGRFYGHSGFDLQAFREAMDYNFEKGRLAARREHDLAADRQEPVSQFRAQPAAQVARAGADLGHGAAPQEAAHP